MKLSGQIERKESKSRKGPCKADFRISLWILFANSRLECAFGKPLESSRMISLSTWVQIFEATSPKVGGFVVPARGIHCAIRSDLCLFMSTSTTCETTPGIELLKESQSGPPSDNCSDGGITLLRIQRSWPWDTGGCVLHNIYSTNNISALKL